MVVVERWRLSGGMDVSKRRRGGIQFRRDLVYLTSPTLSAWALLLLRSTITSVTAIVPSYCPYLGHIYKKQRGIS